MDTIVNKSVGASPPHTEFDEELFPNARPISCNDGPALKRDQMAILCVAESLNRCQAGNCQDAAGVA